jgi:hypothetical protein
VDAVITDIGIILAFRGELLYALLLLLQIKRITLDASRRISSGLCLRLANTGGVERSTHNVITYTREILDTTTAHKDNRVFLQLVTFAWNVRCYLDTIAQAHTGDLPQSRVWLLGCHGATTVQTPRFCGAPAAGRTRRWLIELNVIATLAI